MTRLRILSEKERDAAPDYLTATVDVNYCGKTVIAVLEYKTDDDWAERWEPIPVLDERLHGA